MIENEALTEIIEDIFYEHKARYYSSRIQNVLEQQGIHVNAKRVCRLMSEHGLIPKGTRKYYRYHTNKTSYDEKDNILRQVFSADEKNKIWVRDITYIPTKHGWLYLGVFIDIFSRRVVVCAMDTRVRDTLILSALNQAIGMEHPPTVLIIHTDCGCQIYGAKIPVNVYSLWFRQSMNRKSNPYGNAVMESFYTTLKRELVQDTHYDNPKQARMDIFKYIELYYNTKRIHSAIGWVSLCQFQKQICKNS